MKKIGQILIEKSIITHEQLEEAVSMKKQDEFLGDVLIMLDYATEKDIIEALSESTNIPIINLFNYSIDYNIVNLLPEKFEIENTVLPVILENKILTVATNKPLDLIIIEDIKLITNYEIKIVLATKSEIESELKRSREIEKSLSDIGDNVSLIKNVDENLINIENPVVKLVNQFIVSAIMAGASDIHINPGESNFEVKYRIDGDLVTKEILPNEMFNQIVTRIKVMSNLDITEERRPQDGRIKSKIEDIDVDLRISILPTVHGENVVIRLLDITSFSSIDSLGFSKEDYEKLKRVIELPNGIILLSGPTGSGKSTTLYACLSHLNDEKVNIVTVEDPVEIQIKGLKQVQVNTELNLTFSNVLRSILRQDPNIIMVGEIRDADTASISIRAALTGHLVLSTIHTNTSIKTITRLLDIGIDI